MVYPHFNIAIKALRKRKNLTQEELASRLGITRSALGNYETGIREPDFETAQMFADFFGVSMDALLGRETSMETNKALLDEIESLNEIIIRLKAKLYDFMTM